MRRRSLQRSLALWTMVPMVTFSLFVLLLSSAWAWRTVLEIAAERNTDLTGAAALALAERMEQGYQDSDALCSPLSALSEQVKGTLYVVDENGRILCAPPQARLSAGMQIDHDLTTLVGDASASAAESRRRHIASYAPVPGTSWGVVLEEARADLISPTYSFLISIAALMIVGLFVSFWLLLIGFTRIAWPLSAVTEQAERVAAGEPFIPPDVSGPAEVEALVAAFNHMVTQLGQQRNTLHDYATRMLYSQEEERNRISRDLHDETAQELVGLMQRIDLCRLPAGDNREVLAALDELSELTARTLAGVRRMSQALRPLILEDLGLVAAIQTIADDLDEQLPMPSGQVFCKVIGQEQRLLPEVELTAFRIVQEALTNVRKHAAMADRVYVTVEFGPRTLRISVEDNGDGFDLAGLRSESNGQHLGLIGMRERAELLSGTLEIVSHPGEGTQVALEMPIGVDRGSGPRSDISAGGPRISASLD